MDSEQDAAAAARREYRASPGYPGEQAVTDPVRIRALAHPVRLELLDYLDDAGSATATECAAAIGASVASCSYHLRTLAKHGYIEQVRQPGREKPWKVVSRNRSQGIDPDLAGSVHAVAATASLEADRQLQRIQSWLRRAPELPPEDVNVSTVLGVGFYATHEEIMEFREELWKLTERFDGRRENPERRPQGAVAARLFAVVNVEPEQRP
ncbi:helix-turn-helix domain-containing protein [Arthrobacter sp. Z1-15]